MSAISVFWRGDLWYRLVRNLVTISKWNLAADWDLFVVIVEKQAEYDAANAGKSDGQQQQEQQELHDDKDDNEDDDEDDDDDDDDDDDKSQSLHRSSSFASRDSGIKSVVFTLFQSRTFKRCVAKLMRSSGDTKQNPTTSPSGGSETVLLMLIRDAISPPKRFEQFLSYPVASLEGRQMGGADLPGWHPPGGWCPNKKCGWIYKELWTNEIGQVKKVRGDTLQGVTPKWNKKVTVIQWWTEKDRQFFREK